jgi:hypothetical protein
LVAVPATTLVTNCPFALKFALMERTIDTEDWETAPFTHVTVFVAVAAPPADVTARDVGVVGAVSAGADRLTGPE